MIADRKNPPSFKTIQSWLRSSIHWPRCFRCWKALRSTTWSPISAHGLIEPIIVHEDMIPDGNAIAPAVQPYRPESHRPFMGDDPRLRHQREPPPSSSDPELKRQIVVDLIRAKPDVSVAKWPIWRR